MNNIADISLLSDRELEWCIRYAPLSVPELLAFDRESRRRRRDIRLGLKCYACGCYTRRYKPYPRFSVASNQWENR